MKRRGRAPAPTDQAAVTARAAVDKYLKDSGINVAELSRQTRCSAPAIWRTLKSQPPTWSPTLTKLNEFLNSQSADQASGDIRIAERLAATTRSTRDPWMATAKLLRIVADLLDGGGSPEGKPVIR